MHLKAPYLSDHMFWQMLSPEPRQITQSKFSGASDKYIKIIIIKKNVYPFISLTVHSLILFKAALLT